MKTKAESKTQEVKSKVAALIPDGWQACECFLMSFSGSSSPELIMVNRKGFSEARAKFTQKEARIAFVKQWRAETEVTAREIKSKLEQQGFKVKLDLTDLYVQI